MFRLRELCARNELPFSAEIVPMPHGPWHWLEIRSGSNFLAHVCRTTSPHAFPEETLSRQDARLRNQDDLFALRAADRGDVIVKIREFYAWLTFGIGQQGLLEHLVSAMPPADDGDWLAYRDVLHHATSAISLQPEAPPPTEPAAGPPSDGLNLRFQEHIEESLSKQNKKDDKKSNDE